MCMVLPSTSSLWMTFACDGQSTGGWARSANTMLVDNLLIRANMVLVHRQHHVGSIPTPRGVVGYPVGMPDGQATLGTRRFRAVYTLKGATEIMGVTSTEAVRRAAQRSTERGQQVSWDRNHPDNPTDGSLYVAEWVIEYARRNNHVGRSIPGVTPLWVELPAPTGFVAEQPMMLPTSDHSEVRSRTASAEQQLAMAEAGERAQEVARLEAERDGARQLAELAGRENERLRTDLAQLRKTMAEHLQTMSRAFASPAGS